MIDVSICIVSWNTKELLSNCIESIHRKTVGIRYEIIIVDNASSDGSVEMVRVNYPECKLIENKTNLGFAQGNNVAVKAASGRYILFLNPDTELLTNAVYGMYSHLVKQSNIGAIGCKLVDADGKIQFTCASTFPSPFIEISTALFLNRIFPKSIFFAGRELNYWDHEDSRYVDCLSGACIMVSARVISVIGGFDENNFMYSEDTDLCYAILKRGWKIYYLAEEVIFHHEGASSDKQKKHFATLLQKNSDLYFILKNYGNRQALLYKLSTFGGALFRTIVISLAYPFHRLIGYNKQEDIVSILVKHFKILQWALGFYRIK